MICKDTEFGERGSEKFDKCGKCPLVSTIPVGQRNVLVLKVLLITQSNVWTAYTGSYTQLVLISICQRLRVGSSAGVEKRRCWR